MKKALTLLAMFAMFGCSNAQGWETNFGHAAQTDAFYSVANSPTGDGGLVFVGQTAGSDGLADAFFVRTNALGRPLAKNSIGKAGADEIAQAIIATPDGGFWIAVNQNSSGSDSAFLHRLDGRGQSLFSKKIEAEGVKIWAATTTADGHFLFAGQKIELGVEHIFLIKVDFSGIEIWQKTLLVGISCNARAVVASADGGAFVAGSAEVAASGSSDANLFRINALGDLIWQKSLATPINEYGFGLAETAAGELVVAGFQVDASGDSDALLHFYAPDGAFSGAKIFDNSIEIDELRGAAKAPDGSLVFCGSRQANAAAKSDLLLLKTDPAGNLLFEKTTGGPAGDKGWAITAKADGSLAVAGNSSRCATPACLDAFAVQTDPTGATFGGRIRGKITLDADGDCLPDAAAAGLAGWAVEAKTAGSATFFAQTRADGFFEIEAPAGAFQLSVLMPPGGAWQPCLASTAVVLTQPNDTIEQDFLVKKAFDCSVLQVDLATDQLQKCDTSRYFLTVKNWGSQAVLAPKIRLALDPFLAATGSSSWPFSTVADSLFFDLPAMQPLDNQQITFDLALACGPNFDRQTHAIEARTTPDLLCQTPANWDQSDLLVAAECVGSDVLFTVKNQGAAGLGTDSEFIIIEDILLRIVPGGGLLDAPLAAPAEVNLAADGSTFMIRARNTPDHPSGTRPYAFVEGCNLGGGAFVPGFPLQFAHDDGLQEVEIDCREGWIGPDPDLLKAFPTGWGPQHLIEKADAIDYLLRFENATAAVAQRLEIRDTLSPFLDPSRLDFGASSHPFSIEWRGERTLVFTLDSANLAVGERGFVKYRILPDSAAPLGAVILNRSAAYFDFAAPVFSNQTFHEIGDEDDYLIVSATEPTTAQNMPIRVAPNPFSESCRVDWLGAENELFRVRLTDLAGRVLIEKAVVGPSFLLEKGKLSSGLFLLQVIQNERVMGREKIVLR